MTMCTIDDWQVVVHCTLYSMGSGRSTVEQKEPKAEGRQEGKVCTIFRFGGAKR